jgi:hypothetical protein
MKRARCFSLLVSALGFAALGGCSLLSEQHPTTESRYMTPTEQAYWTDKQMKYDKAASWDEELERQSRVRMSRLMGY